MAAYSNAAIHLKHQALLPTFPGRLPHFFHDFTTLLKSPVFTGVQKAF
jgi:hypothetical protein